MSWMRFALAVYPEIWRYPGGPGESKAIAWSALLPFLTSAVFILVCAGLAYLFLRRHG
jgi:hypothetical protein